MRLVEQHVISPNDLRYKIIDAACFASKNLYNAANYIVRQSFIHNHIYLGYGEVYHQIKTHEAYKALPAKVANDVLRLLDKNWKSFTKPSLLEYRSSSLRKAIPARQVFSI
jgi:putative transposase